MSGSFGCSQARPVLGSSDLDRSRALWCDVLDFSVAVRRDGFMLLRAGNAEVALRPVEDPAPGWVTLEVRDVQAAYDRVVAAGVELAAPLFTHQSGRRDFSILDPDGHRLEVAEPPHLGGRIAWVDLTVEDATTSRDFWAHVGGFDGVEAVSMGRYSDFTLTTDGKGAAGVCHRQGPNAGTPPVWMVYFTVDSLDRALAETRDRGGEVLDLRPPMAVVRGPEGAIAALYQS